MKKFNIFYLSNLRMRCTTYTTTSKDKALKLFWYYANRCIIGGKVEVIACHEVVKNG